MPGLAIAVREAENADLADLEDRRRINTELLVCLIGYREAFGTRFPGLMFHPSQAVLNARCNLTFD
jgi:hypothetical protein